MNEMRNASCCRARRAEESECRCNFVPVFAFVPVQELDCVYEPEQGFFRGTIFPALDKPFMAGGCKR